MFRTPLTGLALIAALTSAASADDLVISNWDGYMAPDAIDAFNTDTDNTAELVLHGTNEEIMGKLIASKGAGYDVVFVSSPFAEVLNKLGIAETLDHAKLPNIANLYPAANELKHDPGNAFSVPYAWGTTGLCYRADLIDETPDSWWDLLTPPDDLKDKVTMLATDRWLLAAAQLANGYSVNTTDEAELAKVKEDLISAKQTLLAYDDTTFYAKLVSGEADLVQAWDGWCNYGIAENADIKYVIPAEGSDLWVDTMVIIKGSEHKDAAYAFVNWMLDAEHHRWAAENILYKVPNKAAMEGLDPSLIATFPNMGITPEDLLGYEQLLDVGEAQRAYSRIVSEIKAAD
ncbi:spermidine/putrescine ABC transporter substrate-binding protein [Pseudooceanicola sediminis]|uniref:Spermidine/putrescine ABC transporter substrate-binding protein n=1 Tax=Pseudooceanicola sediminis TaxID=2211117 RepID=A0A399J3M3_9RHOB|nr:spermidine/putrescine ABC transporter substrate-binding protein [Pseudooceanicola sediminis]KAA2314273.1 spermidine/putrescine ABC transporter substrate-binding protein [Puniceibacterium sp. HSS470]RII39871.1 spermidine/putrescine ABC transporter substrate-binding protein [Pseudooceanicola sediminis]|tara:strand:+ start:5165 stop:6202 length:1038 start_codon:yes stop_codon:yes gene_type:complete